MTETEIFKCAGCGAEYSKFQAECSVCHEMVGTCCGIYIKGTKHGEPSEADMANFEAETDPVQKEMRAQRLKTPGQYVPKTFTRRYCPKCGGDIEELLP